VLLICSTDILIKITTKIDQKNEYPDFTSSFHYIHSFLPRPQTCCSVHLYMYE